VDAPAESAVTASFGGLLRQYRAAIGLTQEELAERAELSVRGLRYLERDLRRPYRDTAQRLAESLRLEPAECTRLIGAARARTATLVTQSELAGRRALPVPPGPLIGREHELRAVSDLVRRDDVRLVTLTGVGGVGKSRLALGVAAGLHPDFSDVIAWVSLVGLNEPNLVPSAIAQTLGLVATGSVTVQHALRRWFANREVLLLLDNFEHLVAAAGFISELVAACPRLKILVTSRVPLGLRTEHEFQLSSLRPPDVSGTFSVYAIAANPAVDLFTRRAQAIKPDFVLTAKNAAAVAAICHRLDGLPLALELAAARIRVLPPGAMLQRLAHRLTFLTGGGPDLPARHRTMRETIAWSYDLLQPAEQQLFRRLAVFAGGCDLMAVERVCNVAGDLEPDVLDLIEALHRNSLLQMEDNADDEPRFAMLQTVREYALEQLATCDESQELRKYHAGYFVELAESGAEKFYTPAQAAWLDRLERDHDNFRAALRWCIEQNAAGMGLRLANALWMLWYVRGYPAEGRAHLGAVLALPGAAREQGPRAEALLAAGQLARTQDDCTAARTLLDESIALFRTSGNQRGVADALLCSGFVARVQEDYIRARSLLQDSLHLSQAIGYEFITAASLHHLGMIATDAEQDYALARSLLQESLTAYRTLGLPRFIAQVLLSLAELDLRDGDAGHASEQLEASLRMMVEVGEKLGLQHALDTYAQLSIDAGEADRAARLAGAAARLRERMGMSSWPVLQRGRNEWLGRVRAELGELAFQAAWAQGDAMTPEEAIACALREST